MSFDSHDYCFYLSLAMGLSFYPFTAEALLQAFDPASDNHVHAVIKLEEKKVLNIKFVSCNVCSLR